MKSKSIKDAKNKEIQSIEIVDKYSTKNQPLIPCKDRVNKYDSISRPHITGDLAFITPETAQEYLNNNPNNRLPSSSNIDKLVKEMKKGEWMVGTDSVGFDTNGHLCNGQHTLMAVIKSGLDGVWLFVMKGIDPKYITKADTGKKRTAADVLKMNGIPSRFKNIIASSSKSAMCILQGKAESIQSTGYITPTECLTFVKANEEQMIESSTFAMENTAPYLDKNTIAFLHFLYSQSNREEFNAFVNELVYGNIDGKETAATQLRKLLNSDKTNLSLNLPTLKRKQKLTAYVVYANLYLQGKTQKKITIPIKFPELFEPTKGNLKKTLSGWGEPIKQERKKAA